MDNNERQTGWQFKTNTGILKRNRLPQRKDLEEYNSNLKKININALDIEENKELIIRSMKAVVSTCYCCYNPSSIHDSRLSLSKEIVLNLSMSTDEGIREFCGNAKSIFQNIDHSDFTKLRQIDILESTANSFSKKHQNGKLYPHSFLSDYNRIVFSSAFRRLQDKAQVFSLEEHDYVRTRLTHTIEVSSIAAHLANQCALRIASKQEESKKNIAFQLEKVLSCAALLHDIGNPPFGHYGEDIIKNFFIKNWHSFTYNTYNKDGTIEKEDVKFEESNDLHKEDFIKYDGNAQSLRIASTLQVYKPGHSLELTAAVLGAIIKYPIKSSESTKDKLGYFYSESKVINDLTALGVFRYGIRNPLALLLEAADDICYVTSDFDDVVKKNILSYEDFLFELNRITTTDEQILRFKRDFEKFYAENRELSVNSPFELTIRRITNDLKLKLISEVIDAFCNDENYSKIMQGISILNNNKQKLTSKSGAETIELLNIIPSANLIEWLRTNVFVKYVYPCKSIITDEIVGHEVLTYLLETLCKAVLHLNFNVDAVGELALLPQNNKKEYKQFEKIFRLISRNFVEQFKEDTQGIEINSMKHIYYRFRLVVDYVSGMTDSYAKEVYQVLKGIK